MILDLKSKYQFEEYTFNCSFTKANWVWQMRRDSKFLTNSLNSIQNSPSSDLLLVMCSYLRVLHSSLLSDQLPVHSLVPWGFLTLTSLRPSLHIVTSLIILEELFFSEYSPELGHFIDSVGVTADETLWCSDSIIPQAACSKRMMLKVRLKFWE